jgi:hypothetical protein
LLKSADAHNLQNFVETAFDLELLFGDGDQQLRAQGNPDLTGDGLAAMAEKFPDPQMLLDPLKEQLDFPAAFIQLTDGRRREIQVVGQKMKVLASASSR